MSFVALKCPGCGASIQLDDTKEYGFCNYCGTKVVQDKVIVEHRGSVVIDTSEEVKNLYVLARRAKENNDTTNAQKYYEQIIVKDPNSWEANFYTVYFQASNCKIANITSSAINVTNNLGATFKLVKKNVTEDNEKRIIINEIVYRVIALSTSLLQGATNHYNGINPSIRANFKNEFEQRKNACVTLCYYCGDHIETYFGTYFIDSALTAWKDGINKSGNKTKSNPYCTKVKQYDPSYKIKKSNFLIFGIPIIWLFVLFVIYGGISKTMGIIYIVISVLAVIGYIVWKIVKKKKQ